MIALLLLVDATVVVPSVVMDAADNTLGQSLKAELKLSSPLMLPTPRFVRMQRPPSTASGTSARSRPTITRSARILLPPTSVTSTKPAESASPSKSTRQSQTPLAILPVLLQCLQVLLSPALPPMRLALVRVVVEVGIGCSCMTSASSPLASA
jgi:hypothetical protein